MKKLTSFLLIIILCSPVQSSNDDRKKSRSEKAKSLSSSSIQKVREDSFVSKLNLENYIWDETINVKIEQNGFEKKYSRTQYFSFLLTFILENIIKNNRFIGSVARDYFKAKHAIFQDSSKKLKEFLAQNSDENIINSKIQSFLSEKFLNVSENSLSEKLSCNLMNFGSVALHSLSRNMWDDPLFLFLLKLSTHESFSIMPNQIKKDEDSKSYANEMKKLQLQQKECNEQIRKLKNLPEKKSDLHELYVQLSFTKYSLKLMTETDPTVFYQDFHRLNETHKYLKSNLYKCFEALDKEIILTDLKIGGSRTRESEEATINDIIFKFVAKKATSLNNIILNKITIYENSLQMKDILLLTSLNLNITPDATWNEEQSTSHFLKTLKYFCGFFIKKLTNDKLTLESQISEETNIFKTSLFEANELLFTINEAIKILFITELTEKIEDKTRLDLTYKIQTIIQKTKEAKGFNELYKNLQFQNFKSFINFEFENIFLDYCNFFISYLEKVQEKSDSKKGITSVSFEKKYLNKKLLKNEKSSETPESTPTLLESKDNYEKYSPEESDTILKNAKLFLESSLTKYKNIFEEEVKTYENLIQKSNEMSFKENYKNMIEYIKKGISSEKLNYEFSLFLLKKDFKFKKSGFGEVYCKEILEKINIFPIQLRKKDFKGENIESCDLKNIQKKFQKEEKSILEAIEYTHNLILPDDQEEILTLLLKELKIERNSTEKKTIESALKELNLINEKIMDLMINSIIQTQVSQLVFCRTTFLKCEQLLLNRSLKHEVLRDILFNEMNTHKKNLLKNRSFKDFIQNNKIETIDYIEVSSIQKPELKKYDLQENNYQEELVNILRGFPPLMLVLRQTMQDYMTCGLHFNKVKYKGKSVFFEDKFNKVQQHFISLMNELVGALQTWTNQEKWDNKDLNREDFFQALTVLNSEYK